MEKGIFVKNIFSSIANKYDLMNTLMSFGIHHLWKSELIKEINYKEDCCLLDVAGGTGDISTRILKKFKDCKIVICDNNFEMIEQGFEKVVNKGQVNIEWICGNAEKLPFCDENFDYYIVAFGVRNFANIEIALEEAYRILKPTGKFICLEFSHVQDNFLLSKAYGLYSNFIVPSLGKLVTGNREAYQYLVDSIKAFPTQKSFANLIDKCGFKCVNFRNLSGGIVSIHTGWKIVN